MSTARDIFPMPDQLRFEYNANAEVLGATIRQPERKRIDQGLLTLAENGAYQNTLAKPFEVPGVLSYKGGYTEVSGVRDNHGHHVTVATAVIEGLDILGGRLTADGVVSRIVTSLKNDEEVPTVSFTGSRYENLRIDGKPIDATVPQDAIGFKPAHDKSYFDERHVPCGMVVSCDTLTGSIVQPPLDAEIIVPDFGTVRLALLTVTRKHHPKYPKAWVYDFSLSMIHAELRRGLEQDDVKDKARVQSLNAGSGAPVNADIDAALADPNGTPGKGGGGK